MTEIFNVSLDLDYDFINIFEPIQTKILDKLFVNIDLLCHLIYLMNQRVKVRLANEVLSILLDLGRKLVALIVKFLKECIELIFYIINEALAE
jgi:hypothetical protein